MNESQFLNQKLMSRNISGSQFVTAPKIDLALLTRRQAIQALHENLNREIIFSGLWHKNYHVRLLALHKIEIKNQYYFFSLFKTLRRNYLSKFRFQLLLEEELYVRTF